MNLTMYYDDSCPICRTEAMHMAENNTIRIMPVSQSLDTLQRFNISQLEAMTYLCVQDDNGVMYKGMEAVRVLYDVAGIKWAKYLHYPVIKQSSEIIYPLFAKYRYKMPKWLIKKLFGTVAEDCTDGVCHLPPKERLK